MKNFIKSLTFLLFFVNASFAAESKITKKWNSKEGLEIFNSSQYKNDFYQLADHFQPQINPLYCGIASSVIILNAINDEKEIASQKELEVTKPKAFGGGNIDFTAYSQLTFLNDKTDKIKDRKIINLQNITKENENDKNVFDPGVTLRQLSDILKIYQLKVKVTHVETVDEKSSEKFRKLLKEILADDKKFLLVNFDGKILDLKTNGHMSLITAFDAVSDQVLVMDVAGHRNGWYWVSVSDMLKAMNTKDGANYRGYLVVSK
ncbi:MAG: hypothetical protein K0R25_789 [Rickettsiaceae bacterium]|nr:hypothetical protein [Rickettsiaceae bacterium]